MQKLMTCLFVNVMIFGSIPTMAQEYEHIDVNYTLEKIVGRSLNSVARRSGAELESGLFDFGISTAESNLFIIVPLATLAATAAVVTSPGPVLSASALFLIPGATLIVSTFSSIFAPMITSGFKTDLPLGSLWIPFNSHWRAEFHYTLAPDRPTLRKNANEGSCLLFFSINEEELTVDYEIDRCTHEDVFPETEIGTMRVGNDHDFLDETFGQTLVVLTESSVSLID